MSMTRRIVPWLLCLPLLASGCVLYEHSLALPEGSDAVFDPAFVGEWLVTSASRNKRALPPIMARIERQSPGGVEYRVRRIDLPDPQTAPTDRTETRIFLLGNVLFMEHTLSLDPAAVRAPGRPVEEKDLPKLHLIERVTWTADGFVLESLDVDHLKAHPASVAHELGGRRQRFVTITAPTTDLRAFLIENGRNDAAWDRSTRQFYRKLAVHPSPQYPSRDPESAVNVNL